jgi:ribosome-associated protein
MAKKTLSAIVIDALEDIKARDIQLVNVSKITSVFDYIAIASADSTRQTKALANNVVTKVKEAGFAVIGTEGEGSGEWVLVDCGDIVVHIMQPAVREYYKLEELWREGKLEFPRPKTARPMVVEPATKTLKPAGKPTGAGAKVASGRGKSSAMAAAKKLAAAQAKVGTAPATAKPASKSPLAKRPAAARPADAKPVVKKPVTKKPVARKPVAEVPLVDTPVAKKPAAKKPVAKKPAAKKPVAKKPAAKKPAAKQPAARKPAARKPPAEPATTVKRRAKPDA